MSALVFFALALLALLLLLLPLLTARRVPRDVQRLLAEAARARAAGQARHGVALAFAAHRHWLEAIAASPGPGALVRTQRVMLSLAQLLAEDAAAAVLDVPLVRRELKACADDLVAAAAGRARASKLDRAARARLPALIEGLAAAERSPRS